MWKLNHRNVKLQGKRGGVNEITESTKAWQLWNLLAHCNLTGRKIAEEGFSRDTGKELSPLNSTCRIHLGRIVMSGYFRKRLEIQLQVHKSLFYEDQNGNSIKMTGKQ